MEGETPRLQNVRLCRSSRPAQNCANPGQQYGDVVGLVDVVVPAQAQGPQLVAGRIPAGDKDDRGSDDFSDVGAQGHTIPTGQPQVQQDQVGIRLQDFLGNIGEIGYRNGLISLICQQESQLLADYRVVLNNDYFRQDTTSCGLLNHNIAGEMCPPARKVSNMLYSI